MYKNTQRFFKSNNKLDFAHGVAYGLEPGFTPIGVERVDIHSTQDNVESLVFINSQALPGKTPDSMTNIVPLYWSHMLTLMMRIMSLSAVALNLPPDYFNQYFNPGDCALRLAHYPGTSKLAGANYGAHTDYTGFTLLRQDEVPGLEVLVDTKWIPVPFVPDSFVINSGDLIQRWTNDRWISK
jgi:isopenicillin N synthase-like dioxygenase